ncbi:hypothetical protein ACFL6U_21355 [Planctomycetota bacterium]
MRYIQAAERNAWAAFFVVTFPWSKSRGALVTGIVDFFPALLELAGSPYDFYIQCARQ